MYGEDILCRISKVPLRHAINLLTHLPLVPHICVNELGSIGSDNGLSPIRRQAIIWTNDGLLSIGPLGANFSEILIKIQNFSFTKTHLKISSAKWRPFCAGGDELTGSYKFLISTKANVDLSDRYIQ